MGRPSLVEAASDGEARIPLTHLNIVELFSHASRVAEHSLLRWIEILKLQRRT
jgi:hypothetical protein